MERKSRYFWGLVNLDNQWKDPKDMEWLVIQETKTASGNTYYDICGSDEGVKEQEIVVFGKTIEGP